MRLLVLLFLSPLLLFAPLAAQSVLVDELFNDKTGTSLKLTAMSSSLPSSGYAAIRVNARNGEKIPLVWNLNFTSKDYEYGNTNQLTSSFSVTCPPGKQKNIELLVPLVTAIQSNSPLSLDVAVSGPPPITASPGRLSTQQQHDFPLILMSEALYTPNSSSLDAAARSGSSRYSTFSFAGKFLPTDLSDDWRAFAGFDILMLTSADWKTVSPGAQAAIRRWNRLGGVLMIYALTPSDTLPALGFANPDHRDDPTGATFSWGQVDLFPFPPSGLLDASDTVAMVKSSLPSPQATLFGKKLSNNWPLRRGFGERAFNPLFFILILIAFAIIVGPINLFVFAKSGQRHRLFLTTPIISVAASALLLLLIVLQDGFGGKGHRLAFIEVRPEENTAYVHQEQVARTGVLLQTGFPLKNHTLINPVALDQNRWTRITTQNDGGQSRYRINEGDQNRLQLDGDWFKSRSEYGHLLTSVQATRGRLELVSPNGPPILTSTFDFPIEKVYYLGKDGSRWENKEPLVSGRKNALQLCSEDQFHAWTRSVDKLLNPVGKQRFGLLLERPGSFVALTKDRGPFLDTLPSLRWTESTAILSGPVVIP